MTPARLIVTIDQWQRLQVSSRARLTAGRGAAGTIQVCAFASRSIMKELNAWTVTGMENVPLMRSANVAPDQRLQRAEAEVRRLTRCIEMKDRQLCELRKALAHSATVHYSFEDR